MAKYKQLELPLVIDSSRKATWSADTWHNAQKEPKRFNLAGPLNERQFNVRL